MEKQTRERRTTKMIFSSRQIAVLLAITMLLAAIVNTNGEAIESSDIEEAEEKICVNNAGGDETCSFPAVEYEEDEDYDDDEEEEEEEDDDDDIYNDDCSDKDPHCGYWAVMKPSECEVNPAFMTNNCRKACRLCERHKRYSDLPSSLDGTDFGEPQSLVGHEEHSREDIEKRIIESRRYMELLIQSGDLDPELIRSCRNENEDCTFWSLLGECDENPGYMKTNCGPACQSCDMLAIEKRCPLDRDIIGPDVWGPGDLDKMFRRLSSEEPYTSKYNVNVLSSPDDEGGGPWVLTMDNFVTNEEADRLIEMGAVEGYKRSSDIGEMRPDGSTGEVVSSGRTSTNAWCSNECIEDEIVQSVTKRISNMTQIPELNSEDLQLLRYEVGQLYKRHHDYIEYEIDRQGGVRLLTVYLYLNDVEAGGGTNFPDLELTVMPKRGRVLIWPSVINSDPNEKEMRTDHQALPVEAGLKYGANAWLHMRNFKDPLDRNC